MALRIDQEQIVKYADKAFLGLAVVFLALSAVLLVLGGKEADVAYSEIERLYRQAEARMRDAQDQMKELLAEDPAAYDLVVKNPAYAEYFVRLQENLPPAWITSDGARIAYYMPSKPATAPTVYQATAPSLEQRVAPTRLLVRQDRGYTPSGNEKNGILGQDRLWVTGQATYDVTEQTALSREAAHAEQNEYWAGRIQTTVVTGYDVQFQERLPDGTWPDDEWRDVNCVTYDDVSRGKKLPIPRYRDGIAAELYANPKTADDFRKKVADFLRRLWQYQKQVLQPPFYELADQELILPYDEAGEPLPEGPEADSTVGELPTARRGQPLPDVVKDLMAGGAEEEAPAEGPADRRGRIGRRQTQELVFHQSLSPGDAGKTFRYRIRARFFNPIFGVARDQVNPEHLADAWKVELPGQWSEPSNPVTIDPIVRFYFIGKGIGDKANFRLFRWIHGTWQELRSVAFDVGEEIAAERPLPIEIPVGKGQRVRPPGNIRIDFDPGATVVDVMGTQMVYQGVTRATEKLVFSDRAASSLGTRLSVVDRDEVTRFLNSLKEDQKPTKRRPRVEPKPEEGPLEGPIGPGPEEGPMGPPPEFWLP